MITNAKEFSAWLVIAVLTFATRILASSPEVVTSGLIVSIIPGVVATLLLTAGFLALLRTEISTPEGLLASFLILFSPMILQCNIQVAPDLFGAAIVLWAIVLMVRRDYQKESALLFGIGLTGLLCGLHPGYLPLLLLPALVGFIRIERPLAAVGAFLAGLLVWLIPAAVDYGPAPYIDSIIESATGHLSDVDDLLAITSDPNLESRRVAVIRAVVSDGLGGYWSGRSPFYLVPLFGLILLFGRGLWEIFEREPEGLLITSLSVVVYVSWFLLYRNPVEEPYGVLPLLPILLAPVWAGGVALMRRDTGGRLITSIALAAIGFAAILS